MELEGKVALVTGAGSGIGKAAALRLAKEGAAIGALSRTESEVRKTVAEIERNGGRAVALVADIAEEEPMKQAVSDLVSAFGRLDIVFANAGINGVWAPIDDLTPAEWDRTIGINLRGTYLTLHYAVPHLKKAKGGAIVITASINGTRTFTSAGATAYSATKAAQVAMAQMLALELAKHRIRVNAICPGHIATSIPDNTSWRHTDEARVAAEYPDGDIPLTGGEAGTSEEVADLVLFLVSDRARHITGTPVWIDGGQSLLV
ncbi:SDR family NAD(P)-dependent oxidoreductase [Microvirga sp. 17 mud 1-3]|uniref:SDR family oxidoreductase n=1 Tax=Microvirga sp. 17 mud 1-3 TaxID=2082949 RepID=UPI000D6C0327|nr:SDR family NAD(P)-dependent oxidoreductase [Microvirga sp. 17 mud 1-3]AWM85948.1 3-oxoacyl-[acyl-carrier-protein] reductase [Microvirga sp. 17 mud 1-3]